MFRHVLVPLDLGGRHTSALRTARALTRPGRGRVTLLHVIQRIDHVPEPELRAFYRRLEEAAQRRLAAAARAFAAARIAVRAEVAVGSPAEEIIRFAQAGRVDLIVMRSHRVEPGRRTRGFGTTSYRVGLVCRCPVLLVK